MMSDYTLFFIDLNKQYFSGFHKKIYTKRLLSLFFLVITEKNIYIIT